MADRPPVSVLLPTTRWTDACTEVATQLRDHDELLIIHDVEDDPVTERQTTPEGVRLIAAGEPEHCSGKANAIATGMETARHDRLVWTDDDFHHPPDWLATLSADYETYGPVSEVPYFVGQDSLSVVLEPLYASAGSLSIYRNNRIWGGAVIFERGDIDEAAFVENLQRTVSDDGLLMEYLQVTTVGRTRIVPIGARSARQLNAKSGGRKFSGGISPVSSSGQFSSCCSSSPVRSWLRFQRQSSSQWCISPSTRCWASAGGQPC